ncbi:MAG: hypothetical protein EZS28_029908, partial [Streblomastix strix]
ERQKMREKLGIVVSKKELEKEKEQQREKEQVRERERIKDIERGKQREFEKQRKQKERAKRRDPATPTYQMSKDGLVRDAKGKLVARSGLGNGAGVAGERAELRLTDLFKLQMVVLNSFERVVKLERAIIEIANKAMIKTVQDESVILVSALEQKQQQKEIEKAIMNDGSQTQRTTQSEDQAQEQKDKQQIDNDQIEKKEQQDKQAEEERNAKKLKEQRDKQERLEKEKQEMIEKDQKLGIETNPKPQVISSTSSQQQQLQQLQQQSIQQISDQTDKVQKAQIKQMAQTISSYQSKPSSPIEQRSPSRMKSPQLQSSSTSSILLQAQAGSKTLLLTEEQLNTLNKEQSRAVTPTQKMISLQQQLILQKEEEYQQQLVQQERMVDPGGFFLIQRNSTLDFTDIIEPLSYAQQFRKQLYEQKHPSSSQQQSISLSFVQLSQIMDNGFKYKGKLASELRENHRDYIPQTTASLRMYYQDSTNVEKVQIKPMMWLLRIVQMIYDDKLIGDITADQQSLLRQSFPLHVQKFIQKRYGLKTLRDQLGKEILASLDYHLRLEEERKQQIERMMMKKQEQEQNEQQSLSLCSKQAFQAQYPWLSIPTNHIPTTLALAIASLLFSFLNNQDWETMDNIITAASEWVDGIKFDQFEGNMRKLAHQQQYYQYQQQSGQQYEGIVQIGTGSVIDAQYGTHMKSQEENKYITTQQQQQQDQYYEEGQIEQRTPGNRRKNKADRKQPQHSQSPNQSQINTSNSYNSQHAQHNRMIQPKPMPLALLYKGRTVNNFEDFRSVSPQ